MRIIPKAGFALLATLILMIIFAYLSISIIQNQTFSSQIDKLKYLEIQAKIHMKNYEQYILSHEKESNLVYKLDDNRFVLNVTTNDTNVTDVVDYHIYIKSLNDNVSIYKKITK